MDGRQKVRVVFLEVHELSKLRTRRAPEPPSPCVRRRAASPGMGAHIRRDVPCQSSGSRSAGYIGFHEFQTCPLTATHTHTHTHTQAGIFQGNENTWDTGKLRRSRFIRLLVLFKITCRRSYSSVGITNNIGTVNLLGSV